LGIVISSSDKEESEILREIYFLNILDFYKIKVYRDTKNKISF